jgi:hypothetical protein
MKSTWDYWLLSRLCALEGIQATAPVPPDLLALLDSEFPDRGVALGAIVTLEREKAAEQAA